MPALTESSSFADTFARFMHSSESGTTPPNDESDLLRAIRAALDRTTSEPASVRYTQTDVGGLNEELVWDGTRVALGLGGAVHKQWSFEHDGQPVQWACRGWLDVPSSTAPRRKTGSELDGEEDAKRRDTFGPFTRAAAARAGGMREPASRQRALFVFLRSIGHMYLETGPSYTFGLPFTVRRAWPLYPVGVLVQRALEPSELKEEDDSELLPTLFSLLTPRSEPAMLNEDFLPRKALVLSVPTRASPRDPPLLVALDKETKTMFICVYRETRKEEETMDSPRVQPKAKPSMARRSSLGGADRVALGLRRDADITATLEQERTKLGLKIGLPPLGALPGMAPSLAPSATLASLAGLPSTPGSGATPGHARQDSGTRTELSAGIDRMFLGGGEREAEHRGSAAASLKLGDTGGLPIPREHTKMRAMHELVLLKELAVSDEDASDPDAIQISLFDARFDGQQDRALLAICFPHTQTLKVFAIARVAGHSGLNSTTPSSSANSQSSAYSSRTVQPSQSSQNASQSFQSNPFRSAQSSQPPSSSSSSDEWTLDHVEDLVATSCAALRATREGVLDLLYTLPGHAAGLDRAAGPGGKLVLLTHGVRAVPLVLDGGRVRIQDEEAERRGEAMEIDDEGSGSKDGWRVVSGNTSNAHVVLKTGNSEATMSLHLDYTVKDVLTSQCLQVLALSLPAAPFFSFHSAFLRAWDRRLRAPQDAFTCFKETMSSFFKLPSDTEGAHELHSGTSSARPLAVHHDQRGGHNDAWARLASSRTRERFAGHEVLRGLSLPVAPGPSAHPSHVSQPVSTSEHPSLSAGQLAALRAPALNALHHLAEDVRLLVPRAHELSRLAPVIVCLARTVRPEWADYWARLVPEAASELGGSAAGDRGGVVAEEDVDDRLPIWPPDLAAQLLLRLANQSTGTANNPGQSFSESRSSISSGGSRGNLSSGSRSRKEGWYDASRLAAPFGTVPAFAFGRIEPLGALRALNVVYRSLCDGGSGASSSSSASAPGGADSVTFSSNETFSLSSGTIAGDVHGDQAGDESDDEATEGRAVAGGNDNVRCAHAAVRALVRMRLGAEFVGRLQPALGAPLREAARTCQLAPGADWAPAAYEFVGRKDLAEGARELPDGEVAEEGEDVGYRDVKHFLGSPHRPSITALIANATALATDEVAIGSGVELGPSMHDFTQIRFGQDKRLEEVARMLRSSAMCTVKMVERPELSEMDTTKEQQATVLRIAERTLALPLGRAMLTFGTVPAVSREAYAIPKLEFSVHLVPPGLTLSPEAGKLHVESIAWGEFHNGVAAALRLAPRARAVDSSWIKFNRPSELTPSHAGLLYGLGLTGHLRGLVTWHTFAYLTPKHELTSIGVLLGLSASHAGTGDRHVTKLLAVHTPALLPAPGADLNVPLATQAAGLVGIGLLYMGARHRRMADICLRQIMRADSLSPDMGPDTREAYIMAAALAFGMVMLGRGTVPPGPADEALLDELRTLSQGTSTAAAASIALGLMYLKSNATEIADILSIPDTVLALNRVPPTLLLLRTLARGLIVWDAVTPTQEWVRAQVPTAILEAVDGSKSADDALELAYYNIIPAACFVLGLKYAGTAREEPYGLLIFYYDLFSRLAYTNGPAYDHKIKRHAIRDGLNLISLALAMVMAGTGEINVLRRLRYSYGLYNQFVRYGAHVATHQSLGLLFLGGGRATLGSSNAAIACMLTAFFPRAAQSSADNKSYSQALRHLWVLAVEPRCLVARDVDTREIVYLPVKIKVRDGPGVASAQLISPSLVPDVDRLLSIRVDTPRYWPFYLDLSHIPRHRAAILRTQTIFVKRRTAFLSYKEDPKGSRSLFVRSGTATGDAATLDFPRLDKGTASAHPAGDLTQFIGSFANEPTFLAFADHFCRVGDDADATDAERLFGAYCHATLVDAILQDKPQALQAHMILFRTRTASPDSAHFNQGLQDLRLAADFYGKTFARRFGPRAPLVRLATLQGALTALDATLAPLRATPEFCVALEAYAAGDARGGSALGWYLLRHGVPASALLGVLRELAQHAASDCRVRPPPEGAGPDGGSALDRGIAAVLHVSGSAMAGAQGSGWSVSSLREVAETWGLGGEDRRAGAEVRMVG